MPSPQIKKSAQVAGRLLTLAGGQMTLARLEIFVYVVDRRALGRWGRSVAFHSYVMSPRGLQPSPTFEQLLEEPSGVSGWDGIVFNRGGQRVRLESARGFDMLSEAEEDLISELHLEYRHTPTSDLKSEVARFPEMSELPADSDSHIFVPDILVAQGYSSQEADEIAAELQVMVPANGLLH